MAYQDLQSDCKLNKDQMQKSIGDFKKIELETEQPHTTQLQETERAVISEMDCDKGYGKPFSDDEKEDSLNGKELKESPELYLEFVTGDTYKKGATNSIAQVKEQPSKQRNVQADIITWNSPNDNRETLANSNSNK